MQRLARVAADVAVEERQHELKRATPRRDLDNMAFSRRQPMMSWTHYGSGKCLPIVVLALLTAASIVPVLVTPIPAMVDYPNHLARMYILSQNGAPDANPYYETAWALYPNLAMDLIVPQISRLVSVENATRLLLLSSQLLIVTGALALERVTKGRVHLAGFAAVMFLYCLPFAWGFVNFEFGSGVMLWGIAAYLAVAERGWSVRFLVNAIFVAGLFAAHFFSLGVYGATIGLYELWRAYNGKMAHRDVALRLMILATPVILLLTLMVLTAGSIGSEGTRWYFEYKPLWLFRIMNGYNLTASSASALALIASSYVATRRGVLKLEPLGIWIAIGFSILYLIIPSRLLGTAFADLRMIPAAALIIPAFCSLSLPSRRWQTAALVIFTGITLANLTPVYWVWLSYRADYGSLIESFRKIDRGSFVLVSSTEDEDPPFNDLTQYPMYYGPTLAVHYANALVANVYTELGKQPVQVRPAFRHLAMPTAGVVPIRVLTAIAAREPQPETPPSIRAWYRDYGYLYVLGPRIPNPLPNLLDEVDSSARFVLYKIRRGT